MFLIKYQVNPVILSKKIRVDSRLIKVPGGFAYYHGGGGLHSGWRLMAAQAQKKTHRSERYNDRSARKLKTFYALCVLCHGGGLRGGWRPTAVQAQNTHRTFNTQAR